MTLAFLNIGTQEMILIVIVILLLFGGKKLPELARGLGRGIREFKDASEGIKREISDQINNFEKDLDVTVEDRPKADRTETKVASTEQHDVVVDADVVADNAAEKKFPQFSAPENTYQHNPGGHPVDDTEYYKYGYNDHFASEESAAEPVEGKEVASSKSEEESSDTNTPTKQA
ncbi:MULTISPECIES: twin-arginine translocase TatA/TatE family subunit [Sphingobacterium]|uniref:Sec-independent protein translocase subunit TatA/TatB n=1 Tax=Sphingobacterium TaxID=28453 RepID=UPI0013DBF4AD|nr:MULTISPECIES: twin-arginine translocase TatA/TatE family subunit [unclassified Sphingobacterium]